MTGEVSLAEEEWRVGVAAKPWLVLWICFALVALTLAVFGQSVHFGFVNYDDDLYVFDNPIVAGGLTAHGALWELSHPDCYLYHPVTMLSLMLDHQVFGGRPGGYHFTNIMLHAGSAILLFLALRRMTGSLWPAALAAALFAIHPLRAESVAWIAERKDVLSGFFFMLTLLAYAWHVEKPPARGRYAAVCVAAALALFAKPTTITLPFVLLLLDYWPLRRQESWTQLVIEKIPLLLLAAAAGATTAWAAAQFIAPTSHLSMLDRVGYALISYTIYLRQMFWPTGLAVLYPASLHGPSPGVVFLAAVVVAGLFIAAWTLRRAQPWLLTGWLWYLGVLAPMVGLVRVGAFAHADRYTYLAQIGLYGAVAWQLQQWFAGKKVFALSLLLFTAVLTLAVCAWKQTAYWHDSVALWTRAIACTTDNPIAENNLGNALLQQNRLGEAAPHLQRAITLRSNYAEAHYNLGNVLGRAGRLDDAIAEYNGALRFKPVYAEAENNLATALRQKGRLDDALVHYKKAIAAQPGRESIHFNYARALWQKGAVPDTIAQYQICVQLNGNDAEAANNLAWLLATSTQPGWRDGARAVQLARRANKLTGWKNPVILATLAAAFAENGRFEQARDAAGEALALARAARQPALVDQLAAALELYNAGQPFRQP